MPQFSAAIRSCHMLVFEKACRSSFDHCCCRHHWAGDGAPKESVAALTGGMRNRPPNRNERINLVCLQYVGRAEQVPRLLEQHPTCWRWLRGVYLLRPSRRGAIVGSTTTDLLHEPAFPSCDVPDLPFPSSSSQSSTGALTGPNQQIRLQGSVIQCSTALQPSL